MKKQKDEWIIGIYDDGPAFFKSLCLAHPPSVEGVLTDNEVDRLDEGDYEKVLVLLEEAQKNGIINIEADTT